MSLANARSCCVNVQVRQILLKTPGSLPKTASKIIEQLWADYLTSTLSQQLEEVLQIGLAVAAHGTQQSHATPLAIHP